MSAHQGESRNDATPNAPAPKARRRTGIRPGWRSCLAGTLVLVGVSFALPVIPTHVNHYYLDLRTGREIVQARTLGLCVRTYRRDGRLSELYAEYGIRPYGEGYISLGRRNEYGFGYWHGTNCHPALGALADIRMELIEMELAARSDSAAAKPDAEAVAAMIQKHLAPFPRLGTPP